MSLDPVEAARIKDKAEKAEYMKAEATYNPQETAKGKVVVLDKEKAPGPGASLAYYCVPSKTFVFYPQGGTANDGWNNLTIGRYTSHLGTDGGGHGWGPKSVERIVTHCENKLKIEYAGPVAGKKQGWYNEYGTKFLVTKELEIPQPREGSWDLLQEILQLQLVTAETPELGKKQWNILHSWMKRSYESLAKGMVTNQQVLIIAGKKNSAKSFIQHRLITAVLGGTEVNAFDYLTGETSFNGEFIGCVHLFTEDNRMMNDRQTRAKLAGKLKEFCVPVGTTRYHPKGLPSVGLRAFHRLTSTVNDDHADLAALPDLSDSMGDKIIILRASRFRMPVPNRSIEEKRAFDARITAEIPCYIHWLLNTFEIPAPAEEEIEEADRFGFAAWMHPDLVAKIEAESQEAELLGLIDMEFFRNGAKLPDDYAIGMKPPDHWDMNRWQIRDRLMTSEVRPVQQRASVLLRQEPAIGHMLKKLEKSHPHRVANMKSGDKRFWRLLRDQKRSEEPEPGDE